MSRLKGLVLLIFAGLYAAQASAGDASAQLSFLQSRNGKTEWMIWSASTNRTSVFMELADEPSLVFWESQPGAVLFVSGKSIFQAEIGQQMLARPKQAALPDGHGDVQLIWRDAASRRLRAIAMLNIAESDVLEEKGKVTYRLPDGRKIASKYGAGGEGLPAACSVLELQADGTTWKLLATRGTLYGADYSPGIEVVGDLRNEAGYSADHLAKSYTCRNGECRNDVPKNLVALASRFAKRKLSSDEGFSIWRPGPGLRSILFGTFYTDFEEAMPPVIILSPDESSGQNLNLSLDDHDIVTMGVAAGLLLVTNGYGAHPVVVDLKTGQVRFSAPEATSAVWVPAPSTP
jgi:hypothetical protein